MNDKINELLERVEAFKPKAAAEIEDFRYAMLGKKGELTALMEEFKSVAPELKREFGQKLNNLKNRTQERINAAGATCGRRRGLLAADSRHEPSRFCGGAGFASSHFAGDQPDRRGILAAGYTVAEGPEIEDDWHVFSRSTSARASGPRHAGYVLYRQEPRRATADPHLVDSGADGWSGRSRRSG